MTKAIPFAIAAAASLALAGCNHHQMWGHHHGADTAKIADEIKAQEAQWQKDYAAKDVSAIAGHYADDAAFGAPGEPLATTDVERRKGIQTLIGDPNLKLSFASDKVQVARSGDLAYSRGHYSIQVTDKATNKPATSTGTYLTVWQKQSDGSFKAVEDHIIPGPAATAAPAAK
jgi:ketosteroid isomerase-like protein